MGSDLENFSYTLGSSGVEINVIPAQAGMTESYSRSDPDDSLN